MFESTASENEAAVQMVKTLALGAVYAVLALAVIAVVGTAAGALGDNLAVASSTVASLLTVGVMGLGKVADAIYAE